MLPHERREILDLKAAGLSSRDIGERLGISERTVQRVLEDLRRRAEELDHGGEHGREQASGQGGAG
jgi:RNA polymerase sigma-70 factor (ECF subfamily)